MVAEQRAWVMAAVVRCLGSVSAIVSLIDCAAGVTVFALGFIILTVYFFSKKALLG